MARDTTFYSLAYVAAMIGECRELIEVVAANSDNIDYGEMIHVHDGTDVGITAALPTPLSERAKAESMSVWNGVICNV